MESPQPWFLNETLKITDRMLALCGYASLHNPLSLHTNDRSGLEYTCWVGGNRGPLSKIAVRYQSKRKHCQQALLGLDCAGMAAKPKPRNPLDPDTPTPVPLGATTASCSAAGSMSCTSG